MSEHLGNPGTASGWALHHYTDTEMCVDCGWWAHTAPRPKNPDGNWARDHAARALRALYPDEAAEMMRRAANDHPAPDRATTTKRQHKKWQNHLRNTADRRLSHRQETAHQALIAILCELWAETPAAA